MKKRLYFCAQHTHPASRKNSALRVSVFFIAKKYDTAYIFKDISVASGANCAAQIILTCTSSTANFAD